MIFKILSQTEWAVAKESGTFVGSAVDLKDGFIHFSNGNQVLETLQKHFAGQDDLVLLGVEELSLGEGLKWEVSRGGDLFPHLYQELNTDLVCFVADIGQDTNGKHLLPDLPQ